MALRPETVIVAILLASGSPTVSGAPASAPGLLADSTYYRDFRSTKADLLFCPATTDSPEYRR
jgi:hypothetical protein